MHSTLQMGLNSNILAHLYLIRQLAAAAAGADVVHGAIDCMSGSTSQPSLGALVKSLSELEGGSDINLDELSLLNDYWVSLISLIFELSNMVPVSPWCLLMIVKTVLHSLGLGPLLGL